MASAKLFAATGDFKNDIELPKLFDEEVNKVCMYLHIKAILNNNRQRSQSHEAPSLRNCLRMMPPCFSFHSQA